MPTRKLRCHPLYAASQCPRRGWTGRAPEPTSHDRQNGFILLKRWRLKIKRGGALSFLLRRFGSFASNCFFDRRRPANSLPGVRRGGSREANTMLITVGELEAGHLECGGRGNC